jgi:hypothetical protein
LGFDDQGLLRDGLSTQIHKAVIHDVRSTEQFEEILNKYKNNQ